LIFCAIASVDGYIEDPNGSFYWARPNEDVLRTVNEVQSSVGTYLYGRRMYDTMKFWESPPSDDMDEESRRWLEHWQATDKIVYSRSLTGVVTSRTRLEREFDPASIESLKRSSSRDLSIGGSELAGHAFAAGLVDELQLILVPQLVGGGRSWLPGGWRHRLALVESRQLDEGFVLLRYVPTDAPLKSH
jgi:dihydrofolate reductase